MIPGLTPIASGAIAAGPPVEEAVALESAVETFRLVESQLAFASRPLTDGVSVSDATLTDLINALLDAVAMGETLQPNGIWRGLGVDNASFNDTLRLAWMMALSEELALAGSIAGQAQRLAALVDIVHATGGAETRVDALVAMTEAVALNTLLASGWTMEAAETVAFQDALASTLRLVGAVVDAAGFSDSPEPQLRLVAVGSDAVLAGDVLAANLTARESLEDGLLLYMTLRMGAAEYAGWVLADGKAPSEYKNYPFNGFASVAGRYYGTSETGLYELIGNTDDGAPIESRIRTGLMDFGTGLLKRAPDVYVAMVGGDRVVLKVTTVHPRTGVKNDTIYTAKTTAGALHPERIKIGQGLESLYWQWELANVDGNEFDVNELSFRPVVLDRRV